MFPRLNLPRIPHSNLLRNLLLNPLATHQDNQLNPRWHFLPPVQPIHPRLLRPQHQPIPPLIPPDIPLELLPDNHLPIPRIQRPRPLQDRLVVPRPSLRPIPPIPLDNRLLNLLVSPADNPLLIQPILRLNQPLNPARSHPIPRLSHQNRQKSSNMTGCLILTMVYNSL